MQATAGYCLKVWPHFAPPDPITAITVFDVALSDSHFNAVKQWSAVVWEGWSAYHAEIQQFVTAHLPDAALK